MVGKNIKIACVGGEAGKLGTNVSDIVNAINEVYDDQGVLIFVDFGSTILGTKTALNLLDEQKRSKIYLVDTPIVEGAFIAAVEASLGKSVDEILKALKDIKSMKKI